MMADDLVDRKATGGERAYFGSMVEQLLEDGGRLPIIKVTIFNDGDLFVDVFDEINPSHLRVTEVCRHQVKSFQANAPTPACVVFLDVKGRVTIGGPSSPVHGKLDQTKH